MLFQSWLPQLQDDQAYDGPYSAAKRSERESQLTNRFSATVLDMVGGREVSQESESPKCANADSSNNRKLSEDLEHPKIYESYPTINES